MNPEKELLEKCLQNNRRAQFELYKKYYGFLMSITRRYYINKEDAESVLNISFLKILDNLNKYRINIPFELWIKKITVNTVIDEYRKNKNQKEKEVFTDMNEQETKTTEIDFDINEAEKFFNAEELLNILHSLPPITKNVFNLFAIDGYTHKEIVEKTGITEGTSKWHVSFARKKLKEIMAEKTPANIFKHE